MPGLSPTWMDRLLGRQSKPLERLWDQVRQRNIPGTEYYQQPLEDIIAREAAITGENPYQMIDRLIGSRWREGPAGTDIVPQEEVYSLRAKPRIQYRNSGQTRGTEWTNPSYGGGVNDLATGILPWGTKK